MNHYKKVINFKLIMLTIGVKNSKYKLRTWKQRTLLRLKETFLWKKTSLKKRRFYITKYHKSNDAHLRVSTNFWGLLKMY